MAFDKLVNFFNGNIFAGNDGTASIGSPDGGTTNKRYVSAFLTTGIVINADFAIGNPSIYLSGFNFLADIFNSGDLILDNSAIGGNLRLLNGMGINAGFLQASGDITTTGGNINVNTGHVSAPTFLGNSAQIGSVSLSNDGFLPPSLTTVQINALPSPVAGTLVFNSDISLLMQYSGTAWIVIPAGPSLPVITKSIASFLNANGNLQDTQLLVGNDSRGGVNNLFWKTDGTSSFGLSDFIQPDFDNFQPDGVTQYHLELALSGGSTPTVFVGGNFTTQGDLNSFPNLDAFTADGRQYSSVNNFPVTAYVTGGVVSKTFYDTTTNILYVTGSFTHAIDSTGTSTAVSGWAAFQFSGTSYSVVPYIGASPGNMGGIGGAMFIDTTNQKAYLFNPSLLYNGATTGNIIRVNLSNGTLDTSFNTANSSTTSSGTFFSFDAISGIALDLSTNYVILIGNFNKFGATNTGFGITKLDTTGVLDPTFSGYNTGPNGPSNLHGFGSLNGMDLRKILVTPTGYYIGGFFQDYNGVNNVGCLIRTTTAGIRDASYAGVVGQVGVDGVGGSFPDFPTAGYYDLAYDPTGGHGGVPAIWAVGWFHGPSVPNVRNILFTDESGVNQFPLFGTQSAYLEPGPSTSAATVPATAIAVSLTSNDVYIMGGPLTTYTDSNGVVTSGLNGVLHIDKTTQAFVSYFGGQQLQRPQNAYVKGFLNQEQIATPAASAIGTNSSYFKSDDGLYSINSAGVEKGYLALTAGVLSQTLSILSNAVASGGLVVGSATGSGNNYSITLGDSVLDFFDDSLSPVLSLNLGAVGLLTINNGSVGITNGGISASTAVSSGTILSTQGVVAKGLEYLQPVNGGSDIATSVSIVVLDPAGALLTYTLTMPVGIVNGQLLTITSTQNITTFTLTPGTTSPGTQTLSVAPTTIAAGVPLRYAFRFSGLSPGGGVWYPV